MSKITIFGMAGTGTSSAGKALAEKLGFEFLSSGNIFREMAASLSLSLSELEELSKVDSKYDIELDKKIEHYGKTKDNFVVDSRLAWYFIPDSFKVALILDDKTRFDRIALREGKTLEQVKEETDFREKMIETRYLQYYGVDLPKVLENNTFDVIIDTKNNSVETVVEMICANFLKS
ncbi:MAG: CMP/dCMP kinase [Patescibacteria group bacterium]|nr:CMP/dCMP kinase [Patescibacteria group bacterium]